MDSCRSLPLQAVGRGRNDGWGAKGFLPARADVGSGVPAFAGTYGRAGTATEPGGEIRGCPRLQNQK